MKILERAILWLIGAWMVFLTVSVLSGCKTYRVSEVIQMHDTLIVSKTDTAYINKETIIRDSFEINTEKIVTLKESGETIRVAMYRDRWRDRNVYIHDTLYKKSNDTVHYSTASEATIEKEKQLSAWEKLKMSVGGISMVLCLLLVGAAALIWFLYRKKK